jgi:hypothetical protein
MNKRCEFKDALGYRCGSYAFNLYKEKIDQGDRCDRHYWQDQAMKAAEHEREACAKMCDEMEEEAEGTECCKWPTPSDCAYAIRARGTT